MPSASTTSQQQLWDGSPYPPSGFVSKYQVDQRDTKENPAPDGDGLFAGHLLDRGADGGEKLVQRDFVHLGGSLDRQRLRQVLPKRVSAGPLDPEQFHYVGNIAVFAEDV